MTNFVEKFKNIFEFISPIEEENEGMNHSMWCKKKYKEGRFDSQKNFLGIVTSENKINYMYKKKGMIKNVPPALSTGTIVRYVEYKKEDMNLNSWGGSAISNFTDHTALSARRRVDGRRGDRERCNLNDIPMRPAQPHKMVLNDFLESTSILYSKQPPKEIDITWAFVVFNIDKNNLAKDITVIKMPTESERNLLKNAFLAMIYYKKAFGTRFLDIDNLRIDNPLWDYSGEVFYPPRTLDDLNKKLYLEMLSLKYLSSIRKNDSKVLVIPLDGKPRLVEDKKNTTPHKYADAPVAVRLMMMGPTRFDHGVKLEDGLLHNFKENADDDEDDNTFLKNIIGTEITSIPCDEYDIFSAKNEKENRLAESILQNAIDGEHNPNGFSSTTSAATHGFLYGTVVVVGNCGRW